MAAGILKKLPPAFETWRIRKQMQMSMSPCGVVLLQELDRFNLLVVRMKKTLDLLRKVGKRRVGLSIDYSHRHKSFSFVLHLLCVFIHLPSWPVTKVRGLAIGMRSLGFRVAKMKFTKMQMKSPIVLSWHPVCPTRPHTHCKTNKQTNSTPPFNLIA